MNWDIRPGIGVGVLEFGMSRNQVREALNIPFRAFAKAHNVEADAFLNSGVFAYYAADGTLDAVEFSRRGRPILYGVNLFGLDMAGARDFCKAAGGLVLDDGGGPISQRLCMGFWSSAAHEDPQAPVESVIVFGPSYFEKYRA